jgi:hypothetical protein
MSGSDEPAQMLGAFEVAAAHGCLLVRDSESDGDISGWDPAGQPWFVDRGSAIFAVQHGGDGMVRCEVWRDGVEEELPHELLTADFEITGALRVGDPEEVAILVLPWVRGRRAVRVLVDDRDWPTRVQVVVT